MGLKQCGKCGEMVDEVKAFCPDCGYPFVDEPVRRELTEHDTFDGTMKLSKSSYNIMLSEMELDITEQPAVKSTPVRSSDQPLAEAKGNSNRSIFIVISVVLLLFAAAVILVLVIAQPFSK